MKKITLNAIFLIFFKINCIEVYNDTELNFQNIQFIAMPENINVGFINNLNSQEMTNLDLMTLKPINHLLIKMKQNDREIMNHINEIITNDGKITFENAYGNKHIDVNK